MKRGREGWKAKERISHTGNQKGSIANEREKLVMYRNVYKGLAEVVH